MARKVLSDANVAQLPDSSNTRISVARTVSIPTQGSNDSNDTSRSPLRSRLQNHNSEFGSVAKDQVHVSVTPAPTDVPSEYAFISGIGRVPSPLPRSPDPAILSAQADRGLERRFRDESENHAPTRSEDGGAISGAGEQQSYAKQVR